MSSNHDIDINPESPPKKMKKLMVSKQAPSKAEKTPKHRRKNRPATKAHQKKPRNHHRRNHLATKAQPRKPSEHSLPTSATTKAEKTTNDKENV
jgi:hypothetical protein